jgi:hypothetical protein
MKPRQPGENQGANSGRFFWKMRGQVMLFIFHPFSTGRVFLCRITAGGVPAGKATLCTSQAVDGTRPELQVDRSYANAFMDR